MGSSASAAASAAALMKLGCVVAVVMCMVMATGPQTAEGAVTCGAVSSKLAPCLGYLTGSRAPSPGCCAGIKGLNSAAATPADRKTACTCLKSAAGSISGLDYGKAAGLPSKCGVHIPYAISPNTDCNAVH